MLVVGVIAASYRYLPRSGFRLHLALGLQLGGAVGNLIDRIRQGYVVDFVDFGYHSNWWPVFNVADSAIVDRRRPARAERAVAAPTEEPREEMQAADVRAPLRAVARLPGGRQSCRLRRPAIGSTASCSGTAASPIARAPNGSG